MTMATKTMVHAHAIPLHKRRPCSWGTARLKIALHAPATIIHSASLMFWLLLYRSCMPLSAWPPRMVSPTFPPMILIHWQIMVSQNAQEPAALQHACQRRACRGSQITLDYCTCRRNAPHYIFLISSDRSPMFFPGFVAIRHIPPEGKFPSSSGNSGGFGPDLHAPWPLN